MSFVSLPESSHASVLVQWLLPINDNDGARFPQALFADVRGEMTEAFGGVTAYPHAPALGLWDDDGVVQRDQLVLFEVLVASFDRAWWSTYRDGLCKRFQQEAIQLRIIPCEVL